MCTLHNVLLNNFSNKDGTVLKVKNKLGDHVRNCSFYCLNELLIVVNVIECGDFYVVWKPQVI